MNNKIFYGIAIAVILYLLYTNKKAKETIRKIAGGVIPDVLVTPDGTTATGSTVLPSPFPTNNNVVVVSGSSDANESIYGTNSNEAVTGTTWLN